MPHSRVWDIVEKARIGMLTTHVNGRLRARPLEARLNRAAGIIGFVTDVRGAKDDEIDAAHAIGLVFIDAVMGFFFLSRAARLSNAPPPGRKRYGEKATTTDLWVVSPIPMSA